MPPVLKVSPTLLTLARLPVLPVLLALLSLQTGWATALATLLYIAAAATDYLDGWVARTYHLTSRKGEMLDQVVDKVFVSGVMVILVSTGAISGAWVLCPLLILAREFLVSGLREALGSKNIVIPVSPLSKSKTAVQMIALGVLVAGFHILGLFFLLMATLLTVVTGWDHVRGGWRHVDA